VELDEMGVRTQLLDSERIRGLCEEVCGILVFLCAAAKETEATRSSLERFFGLEVAFEVSDRSVVLRRGEMEGWISSVPFE
jgi:hypothetical protein